VCLLIEHTTKEFEQILKKLNFQTHCISSVYCSLGKDALVRSGEVENERNCNYNETVRQVTKCGAGGGMHHMRKIK
jgi:hypothetical protein